MPGRWDTSTKRLVNENPADFIRWLVPNALFTSVIEAKSLNLNDREIEADTLYEIVLNDLACLIHIEFQSYYDEWMARRMWEYNALATFSYNIPTYSFVVYLKPCKAPEPYYAWNFPTGEPVHFFHFKVIKLWEIPAEVIKQAGLIGILPLMILAKGGKKRKVVEEVISTIQETGGKAARELLSLTFIMAALVFEKDNDQIWLKRRFGMLEDALKGSWAYQEILQRGWQEGQEKGWQQGMQQGMQQGIQQGIQQGMQQELMLELQRLRILLENFVQVHFPNSVELAKKRGSAIEQPDKLQDMLLKVFAAQTEEEAVRILKAN